MWHRILMTKVKVEGKENENAYSKNIPYVFYYSAGEEKITSYDIFKKLLSDCLMNIFRKLFF